MSEKPINQQFQDDLEALKVKYPMCYIEAWTPDDYVSAVEHGTKEQKEAFSEQLQGADWTDERYVDTTISLARGLDANHGTNWERLRDCLQLES